MVRKPQTRRRMVVTLLLFFLLLVNGFLPALAQIETHKTHMNTVDSQGVMVTDTADSVKANPPSVEQTQTATLPAVLVELFTSEGCSSCPPADKILAHLIETQPVQGVQVIALSEHVDYWNRLGWKDPFSAAEFSQRQLGYTGVLGAKDVYTPQMIVDGRTGFVGSKLATALEAIAKAALNPKADVRVSIKVSVHKAITLTVQAENIPAVSDKDSADVMMAITENGLMSKVSRGENSGRDLVHSAVTRRLTKIGAIKDRTFTAEQKIALDSAWKRHNLTVVIFVQERASRKVLGVTAIKIANAS
jgi:hypothetical protein